jgi:predicted RNase H-like HicB family nuclease
VSTYAIIIEWADDGGYGARIPDVPGCVALEDTEAEALTEMKEAIGLHLDVMRERTSLIRKSSRGRANGTTVDAA